MGGGSGSGSGAITLHAHGAQIAPLHGTDNRLPSTKSCSKNNPTSHPPPGLKNVGNTCFANAALQCLLSTPLSHALLDPKTAVIFRSYSSNLNILRQGSGEVDTDDSSDEDDICDNFDPFPSSSMRGERARFSDLPAAVAEDKRKRREERQKRREERRKEREKRDLIEKCGWVTRELKVITREYTRVPSTTDATEASKSSGRSGGFFSSWSYAPPPPPNPVVDPGQITRHVNKLSRCLRPYQQEDAHEFLRALLSTLIMDGHNKELSSLFDGLLESAITCKTCRRVSLTRDRYMDLSLDINHDDISSLPKALKAFTATETLDDDNMVNCDRCGVKRAVTKGLRLATAPTVLVCHLKRFAYDKYGRTIRLARHVEFPLRLDIGDFMSRANRSTPPPYELVGVLVHTGRSCDSGHYLSFVKSGQSWYKCNDAIVTRVPVETVLEQRAYILLYEVAGMREKHGFRSFHRYHEESKTTVDPLSVSRPVRRSGDQLSWTTHKTTSSPAVDPLSCTIHRNAHNDGMLSVDESFDSVRQRRSQSLTKASHTPVASDGKDLDTMSDSGSQGGRRRLGDNGTASDSLSAFFNKLCGDDILDSICNGSLSSGVPAGREDEERSGVVPQSKPSISVHRDFLEREKERCKLKRDERFECESGEYFSDDEEVCAGSRSTLNRSASSGNFREMEINAAKAYQYSRGSVFSSEDIGDVDEEQIRNLFSRIPSSFKSESNWNMGRPRSKSTSRVRPSIPPPSQLSKPKSAAFEASSQYYRNHTESPPTFCTTNEASNTLLSCPPSEKSVSWRRHGNLPPLHRKNNY